VVRADGVGPGRLRAVSPALKAAFLTPINNDL
jgi:hypothetical protein